MACKECGGNGSHHKPGCGMSPAVLQINNKDCTLFHNVTIPAIMGDETENPPTNGLYKNVLLYYEASGNAYFYSSDGIPTKLTYATTDYNALTNKPTINGVTLEGNQSSSSLGININDATLTIKQGDTTLGTFSANASENAEINIPGGGEDILSVTMSWDEGETGEWLDAPNYFLGQGIDFDLQTNSGRFIGAVQVPSPAFTNDATGASISVSEICEAIDAGTRVIFNNVPMGWYRYGLSDERPVVQPTEGWPSGISISMSFPRTESVGTYSGMAYMPLFGNPSENFGNFYPVGFFIVNDTARGVDTVITQGLIENTPA